MRAPPPHLVEPREAPLTRGEKALFRALIVISIAPYVALAWWLS